ncbi:MAG: sialate O-acetylesterase [Flavisolibacter sp.]
MSKNFPLLFLLFSSFAHADVRLPAILSSHMVVQQKNELHFWGWCEPGEKIQLKTGWDTTTYSTTGTSAAKWTITLRSPAAGGPYDISITGNNHILIEDVLVGEVWLCSGQSNMEMSVNWGLPYSTEVNAASNQQIRFFQIPRTTALYPQEDLKAHWVVCNPEDMKRFSAAGYFFGLTLQQQLQAPVGLINASWGGTPAEAWTPNSIVENDSILKIAASKLKPSNGWPVNAGSTFNGMIYPLTNFAIAGAIWYQGESNVGTANTYTSLFTRMIRSWRSEWKKDFPFYFVQIAPFAGYGDKDAAAFLREAQTNALELPHTGMVLTTDLVDNINDIHPKLKKEVGQRLANYALSETYGKNIGAYQSPVFKSMKVEKNHLRIYFDHAAHGLVSRGGAPGEIFIAGPDHNFLPANARIEKDMLVVWNDAIRNPVAVRFAFSNAPRPNLFNSEGLPVIPFRTDHW